MVQLVKNSSFQCRKASCTPGQGTKILRTCSQKIECQYHHHKGFLMQCPKGHRCFSPHVTVLRKSGFCSTMSCQNFGYQGSLRKMFMLPFSHKKRRGVNSWLLSLRRWCKRCRYPLYFSRVTVYSYVLDRCLIDQDEFGGTAIILLILPPDTLPMVSLCFLYSLLF